MQQRNGVASAGTWCVDLNKRIAVWPAEDTANEIIAIDRQNGGSGSNMAFDLRRLDPTLPVEAMGAVGDDDDGRFLLGQCDALGIDRTGLRVIAGAPTSCVDAFFVAGTGRRTHFFHQGVAALLSPDHFDFTRSKARLAHIGLPGTHRTMDAPWRGEANGWVAVLKAARAAGLETNLELMTIDRERLAAFAAPCLPHLDYLIVNDFEIGAVAGIATRNESGADAKAILRAIDAVFARGALKLIAVHFPEGAVVAARDGARLAKGSVAIPADEIVSANGAGDGFAAGFLYGLHQGWAIERCASLAHASAAASMRAMSTTAGVAPWADCLALAERWGWRDAPS
ncbi:MAG: carbohydrate kinase family protein [Roseiarcus sp.]